MVWHPTLRRSPRACAAFLLTMLAEPSTTAAPPVAADRVRRLATFDDIEIGRPVPPRGMYWGVDFDQGGASLLPTVTSPPMATGAGAKALRVLPRDPTAPAEARISFMVPQEHVELAVRLCAASDEGVLEAVLLGYAAGASPGDAPIAIARSERLGDRPTPKRFPLAVRDGDRRIASVTLRLVKAGADESAAALGDPVCFDDLGFDSPPETPAPSRRTYEETQARDDLADRLVAHAGWCLVTGAKNEGLSVAREGSSLGSGLGWQFAHLERALSTLSDDAAGVGEAVAARRKASGRSIASAYDRVIDLEPQTLPEIVEHVLAALRWSPGPERRKRTIDVTWDIPRRARAAAGFAATGQGQEFPGLILSRAKAIDPEGTSEYERVETELARRGLLCTGPDGEMCSWISLPSGWKAGSTYPVMLVCLGRDFDFLDHLEAWIRKRSSIPAIIVIPCMLTGRGALDRWTLRYYPSAVLDRFDRGGADTSDFDGAGIDRTLALVHARFGGDERVFLYGKWSGASFCVRRLFREPARVRGVALNLPAYGYSDLAESDFDDTQSAPDGGGPPILIMMEKARDMDKTEGIVTLRRLNELGYVHVTHTLSALAPIEEQHTDLSRVVETWGFVDRVLQKK